MEMIAMMRWNNRLKRANWIKRKRIFFIAILSIFILLEFLMLFNFTIKNACPSNSTSMCLASKYDVHYTWIQSGHHRPLTEYNVACMVRKYPMCMHKNYLNEDKIKITKMIWWWWLNSPVYRIIRYSKILNCAMRYNFK